MGLGDRARLGAPRVERVEIRLAPVAAPVDVDRLRKTHRRMVYPSPKRHDGHAVARPNVRGFEHLRIGNGCLAWHHVQPFINVHARRPRYNHIIRNTTKFENQGNRPKRKGWVRTYKKKE